MFSFNFLIIVKGLTATSVQNAKFSSFYEFLWKMAAPSMYGKVILAFRNCFGGWKDFFAGYGNRTRDADAFTTSHNIQNFF